MNSGEFYFIDASYFVDFPDKYLEKNKEILNGISHNRPCFYSFQDKKTGLYWMIPFSSRTEKYRKIYEDKIQRYHTCDTIVFGYVLGYEKAFLIQNMFPISNKYIKELYLHNNNPVKVDKRLETELIKKATKVLQLARGGRKVIFPDVFAIERKLLEN